MTEVQTQFFTKTSDAWQAMLGDVESASASIDIEQYIFTIDLIGQQFIDLLIQKAKAGLRIRLLCDTVGSWSFYRSPLPEQLRSVGIHVKFFNPVKPWRITNFTANFFRDHRKIMIIDDHIAHLGGVGIKNDMADWRDTHMRVTGLLVPDIMRSFEIIWRSMIRSKRARFTPSPQFVKNFNVLTNSPRPGQRFIYQALISQIRNAKKYIYLTTPYFIPDIRLFRILRLAAKRGVDVRIMVPEIADHYFINHARESYFTLALKAGIRIRVYKGVMMHAKSAVIDDEWATTGSFNLDSLSFYFNHEINIAASDPAFVAQVKQHFFEDIQLSREVQYEQWIHRPLRKKFLELLTWPFHSIM
ncbi:MAG: phospholipase D-like domain-containing protein [bacterium]|nr:phospholipase D-like domain-containing protein [bacterium]